MNTGKLTEPKILARVIRIVLITIVSYLLFIAFLLFVYGKEIVFANMQLINTCVSIAIMLTCIIYLSVWLIFKIRIPENNLPNSSKEGNSQ